MIILLLLAKLIDIYVLLIVIRAVISWFPVSHSNPLFILLYNITEPVLKPFRSILPMSGIDFSPLIAIIILQIIRRILVGG